MADGSSEGFAEGAGLTNITVVPGPARVAEALPRGLVTHPVLAAAVLLTALSKLPGPTL